MPTSHDSENGIHMLVLAIIAEQNRRVTKPSMEEVAELSRLFEVQADYFLNDLVEKGYVGKESNSQFYDTYDYFITESGVQALERYRAKLKDFVSALMQCYRDNKKDELYGLLVEYRDWLWFAYREGYITKQQLRDMASMLGASMTNIWWDESLQKWMSTIWSGGAYHI